MERQKLPNATLVLVLGILSIIGCCCYGVPGVLLGVITIIVANKELKTYNENPEIYTDAGNVKAGRIMAIIAVILSVLFILGIFFMLNTLGLSLEDLQNEELLREKLEELQNQQ